jgi:hypothetical protein
MNTNLKVLISAVGFVALAASPVFAKSHVHHTAPAAVASKTTVVGPNGVVGTDPDPAIRSELQRDWIPAGSAW